MKNNKDALRELAQYYNMRKVCELAGVSYSSFKNWKSYNAPFSDEKCTLLLKIMSEIKMQETESNIKRSVYFITDLLTIPIPTVYLVDQEPKLIVGRALKKIPDIPYSSKGRTFPEKNLIILDKHQDDDMLLISLAHEIRHIYQHRVVYDEEYKEDEERKTRRIWKDNFKNYLDSSYENYEDQALELDANAFSWIIAKTILGKEITIKCDHKKLKIAIDDILSNFTLDEIKEVANDFDFCKGITN